MIVQDQYWGILDGFVAGLSAVLSQRLLLNISERLTQPSTFQSRYYTNTLGSVNFIPGEAVADIPMETMDISRNDRIDD